MPSEQGARWHTVVPANHRRRHTTEKQLLPPAEPDQFAKACWLEGGEQPCEVARKPYGRIAIANADAAAYAYTDAAIDQAYRAVQELSKQG